MENEIEDSINVDLELKSEEMGMFIYSETRKPLFQSAHESKMDQPSNGQVSCKILISARAEKLERRRQFFFFFFRFF